VTLELALEYIEDDELIEVNAVVHPVAQARAGRHGASQAGAQRAVGGES